MDPKHKSGDAGKSHRPKRSFKVLPLSEKLKLLYLNKERKHADVANIFGKSESCIREIVKKEKEILLVFLLHLRTSEVMAKYTLSA